MKKILKILISFNTAMPTFIATNYCKTQQNKMESDKTSLPQSNIEYKVDIITKRQEKDNWCGIAVLQAIYRSITKKEITQKKIAQKIFKNHYSSGGTNALHIYNFLSKFLTNIIYSQKAFDKGFGANDTELFEFQNYIKNSLINGAPVLVNSFFNDNSGTKIGHTLLISAIRVDEQKPSNTVYYIWNPDGDITTEFPTSAIQFFYHKYMGDIFVGEKIDKDNSN